MMTLSQQLTDYLAVRRSLGFDLTFEERVLRVFTAFADREPSITSRSICSCLTRSAGPS